jgi:hypothetical protein
MVVFSLDRPSATTLGHLQLAWMGFPSEFKGMRPTFGVQPWGGSLLSLVVNADVC